MLYWTKCSHRTHTCTSRGNRLCVRIVPISRHTCLESASSMQCCPLWSICGTTDIDVEQHLWKKRSIDIVVMFFISYHCWRSNKNGDQVIYSPKTYLQNLITDKFSYEYFLKKFNITYRTVTVYMVYRHRAYLFLCYTLMWNITLKYTTTHFNVFGQTWLRNPSPNFHTQQRMLSFIMLVWQ